MQKLVFKYVLEFIVIVLGISVSFWFDKYQTSLEHLNREQEVVEELRTELGVITQLINNREKAFRFDQKIIKLLIGDSLSTLAINYKDLIIATTDYRGFKPSEEIYTSLKYDGGLKFIRSNKIKVAIEEFYNGTKYGIIANLNDEIFVQRDILKHLQYNYPKLLLDSNNVALSTKEKIQNFERVVQRDATLKSLLVSKMRFMDNKLSTLQNYKNSLARLQAML